MIAYKYIILEECSINLNFQLHFHKNFNKEEKLKNRNVIEWFLGLSIPTWVGRPNKFYMWQTVALLYIHVTHLCVNDCTKMWKNWPVPD